MTDKPERKSVAANPVRIHHAEFRTARKLLSWSRVKLARRAGVPLQAVAGFELHGTPLDRESVYRLRRVLEFAGIDFVGRPVFPAYYAYRDGRPGVIVSFSGPRERRRGRS